jgi:hypothetical protein
MRSITTSLPFPSPPGRLLQRLVLVAVLALAATALTAPSAFAMMKADPMTDEAPPTDPPAAPIEPIEPVMEGDGEGGGGGGGGGGTTTPPPAQFRLRTHLFVNGGYGPFLFEAFADAYFERNENGSWQRYRAQDMRIRCYVNGRLSDKDYEEGGSRLHMSFIDRWPAAVRCDYTANNGAYSDTRWWLLY